MNTFVQQRFVENLLGAGHSASQWRNCGIVPGFIELTSWGRRGQQMQKYVVMHTDRSVFKRPGDRRVGIACIWGVVFEESAFEPRPERRARIDWTKWRKSICAFLRQETATNVWWRKNKAREIECGEQRGAWLKGGCREGQEHMGLAGHRKYFASCLGYDWKP